MLKINECRLIRMQMKKKLKKDHILGSRRKGKFSLVAQSCPTLRTRGLQNAITSSRSMLKLMSIQSVMPSSHLILCRPLLLLPSVFPSIRVFSNGSILHIRWPKDQSFSFSISPSNQYSGLISFRVDWLDLLADQGTQESSPIPWFKSVLQQSTFFIVELSHPYMTTGKTIALTIWKFVGKGLC